VNGNGCFPPIADRGSIDQVVGMRCFFVLVHGSLHWHGEPPPAEDGALKGPPTGFYCHRYVFASAKGEAEAAAFARVRKNLDRQTGWISRGLATLELEAEEVAAAPMRKLLKRENQGHTFY
jgi:hypothetical protein